MTRAVPITPTAMPMPKSLLVDEEELAVEEMTGDKVAEEEAKVTVMVAVRSEESGFLRRST